MVSIFIWVFSFTACVNLMCRKPESTFVLAILVWMLLGFFLLSFAEGQTVTTGVKVGDWVKYGSISVTWDSEQMEPDPELVELNNTLWFRNEVSDIKDTLIFFKQTTQFKNETQKASVFLVDINSGEGNGTLMFASAELSTTSLLYPASLSPVWINETTTRDYAGASRAVNHLSIITQITEEDPPKVFHFSISHYWDKETGVLAERQGFGTYTDQAGSPIASWTRSDKITETNLWESSDESDDDQSNGVNNFPYATVGIVAVAVVLVGTWLFWRRRKRFKRRKARVRR